MESGSLSLEVFRDLDLATYHFITSSEILLPQVVLYFGACLNSLVGPRCLSLKVSNFDKYNFHPREFLASLIQIYVKLFKAQGTNDSSSRLINAVIKETSYSRPELFSKAVS